MLENDPDFNSATVYIAPPLDPNCSDENSGDEDSGSADNLTRRQLEADAEVTIWRGAARIRLVTDDDNDNEEENSDVDRSAGQTWRSATSDLTPLPDTPSESSIAHKTCSLTSPVAAAIDIGPVRSSGRRRTPSWRQQRSDNDSFDQMTLRLIGS